MLSLYKGGHIFHSLRNTIMDLMMPNSKFQVSSPLPVATNNLPLPKSSTPCLQFKQSPPSHPPSLPHQPTNLDQTKQAHAHLIRTQFGHSHVLPVEQSHVHPSLAAQFNCLITSYTRNNSPRHSLRIYLHLRVTNTFVDNFTVPSVLKACGRLSVIRLGREIHGFVMKMGFACDVFVQNSLMQMYSECRSVESTRRLFDRMPNRDVVSWSTMIRSYTQNRSFNEALEVIKDMHLSRVNPSEIALINMINLFADMAALKMGRSIHTYLIKNINSEIVNVNANTALIDMYVKCGRTLPARRIFDRTAQKTIVTWTAMIAGYIRSRKLEEGLKLFWEMQNENVSPNEITMLSLVLECGFTGALDLGKLLHAYIVKNGFTSVVLNTALVDMYGKCGDLKIAGTIFESMDEKDSMTWTAMISGYALAKCQEEAFALFVQMKKSEIMPNEVTVVSLLSLCAEAGALDLGRWVHNYIEKTGIVSDTVLATALIDMYVKCGEIEWAYRIFAEVQNRDICMWNAMMGGLGMHGHGKEALQLFSAMERENIKPNEITFIGLLHACSHAGLVEDGYRIFNQMINEFELAPRVEHYGCMVDLLGRAGLLKEAYEMIKDMPIQPNIVVWGALLASCKLHKNLNLAKVAANHLLGLDPLNSGYNVLMSNMYAAESKWNEVADLRRSMKDIGIKKPPGFSSIEVKGSVHEFVMGDGSHPRIIEINKKLVEMNKKLKEAGYVANTSAVLLNIDEEEKETALSFHSEKLAMAFGLINTAPMTPIRIVKNLRVCDDCHSATKLLSKIYGRVIIVRDRNRFHQFTEGTCSCNDYW